MDNTLYKTDIPFKFPLNFLQIFAVQVKPAPSQNTFLLPVPTGSGNPDFFLPGVDPWVKSYPTVYQKSMIGSADLENPPLTNAEFNRDYYFQLLCGRIFFYLLVQWDFALQIAALFCNFKVLGLTSMGTIFKICINKISEVVRELFNWKAVL